MVRIIEVVSHEFLMSSTLSPIYISMLAYHKTIVMARRWPVIAIIQLLNHLNKCIHHLLDKVILIMIII